ncbi:MAG: ribose 5-phosphate isomerase B [Erysipelotrichaceae bacterium]|nr:ribose 5-phosphate isomerase B [Erysipelotrichaceae bacterium]
MKIAIGNDHGAYELKFEVMKCVEELGHEVINFGVDSAESVDYPAQGLKVANAVISGEADLGIALCGTGVGISMACNKVKGIRAVVCSEPYSAKMSREHNNANILCMGGRVVGPELGKMIVREWLNAEFQGGRHQRRVNQIMEIEETGTLK